MHKFVTMDLLAVGLILVIVPEFVSASLEECQNCNCCVDNICSSWTEHCTTGCIDGIWGNKCYNSCPSNCKVCDRNPTGSGPSKVHNCESCIDGHYIDNSIRDCSLKCPERCKTCTRLTVCIECVPPYYNKWPVTDCSLHCPNNCEKCDPPGTCTVCRHGFFDVSSGCSNTCPQNCSSCTSLQECTECETGFYNGRTEDNATSGEFNDCRFACRPSCKACNSYNNCSSCVTGTHGIACLSNCPSGCLNNICQKETGFCDNCHGNFKGDRCDECKPGWYTDDCSQVCPSFNCKDITCNRVDGACPECQEGWFGNFCNATCSTGCIGNTCVQTTGVCSRGCRASFTGDKCCIESGQCQTCLSNDECQTCIQGYYGDECDQRCSENCTNGCNKTSGECANCKTGKYGTFCELNCSTTCDQSCDRGNGQCSLGCIIGLHGNFCNSSCHSNCMDKICEQESGHCLQCLDGYEGTTCSKKNPSSNIVGPVVGGVVGFIVLVVVLLFGFFYLRRRNSKKEASGPRVSGGDKSYLDGPAVVKPAEPVYSNVNGTDGSFKRKEPSSDSLEKELPEEMLEDNGDEPGPEKQPDQDSCYYNLASSIKVTGLCDFVMKKSKDSFREEFWQLPKRMQNPITFAKRPENIKKNRYNGIYPYDHTRVQIKGDPSFFINASYIDGYEKEKRYIASLGPTKKTTEDFKTFWRMVWHEKSDVVVMLTNLHEISGMKCEQYWSNLSGSIQYGDVTVACDNENEFAEYTVRTLTVSKGAQKRTLTQIHYTAWPDKDVPNNVTSLVELRQRVTDATRSTTGPIIVHCSAGVGRTGTYIALDRLIEEGEATGSVNVFGCIMAMREQRVNMVQTPEQYVFLHKALAYSLTTDCKPIRTEAFVDHVRSMTPASHGHQLQQLKRIIEENLDEEEAKEANSSNVDENRKGADIPGDRYRPRLHINRAYNESDYINATNIDSFKEKNNFIVAQTPLHTTVQDFLELIYQESCSCIVSFANMEGSRKDVGTYLPSAAKPLKEGCFTVTCKKTDTKSSYVLTKIIIKNTGKQRPGEKTLHHFEYKNWQAGDRVPKDAGEFVQFVKDVESESDAVDEERNPVLVHCLNAGERSGLFCVVAILLEKMQAENQVSVVNTVRQVQNRRKSAVGNKEQVEFCYRCIATLLESSNIYANFMGNLQ